MDYDKFRTNATNLAAEAPPATDPRLPDKTLNRVCERVAECQAILVFVDLEKRAVPPQDALHSSFALTPAEARLAVRVAAGAALDTIAEELKITKQTARNQLKIVFQKTDVRRQAELVALLASFLSQV